MTLLGRERPDSLDYWDGNWLVSQVQVAAGGFHGVARNSLRADELAEFHEQLGRLLDTLAGEAALETMERWLSLRVLAQRGQVVLHGELWDQSGIGNRLLFQLRLDQSYLRPFVQGLGQGVAKYPVVGRA